MQWRFKLIVGDIYYNKCFIPLAWWLCCFPKNQVFIFSPTDDLSLPTALLMLLSPSCGTIKHFNQSKRTPCCTERAKKRIWCGADNLNIHRDYLKLSAACKREHQAQSAAAITCKDGKHHQTVLSAAESQGVQSPALSLPPTLRQPVEEDELGWPRGFPAAADVIASDSCLADSTEKERGEGRRVKKKKGMK